MNVRVISVDTRPTLDAYHQDTGQETRTVLHLDPERREVHVYQRDDAGGYPAEEWNNLILTLPLVPRPDEDALREYLNGAGQELLSRICDGFYREWNGQNIRGHLNDDAGEAWDALEEAIAALPESDWGLWSADDWLSMYTISSDTEEGLEAEAAALEAEAEAAHQVIYGDILEELREKWRREHDEDSF